MQEMRTRMAQSETIDPRTETMKRGMIKRGLYEVGHLASLLSELGWVKSSTEWEAGVENDGSTVPAQLGEALKALGDVLIAMTAEEVAELVGVGEAGEELPEPADADEAGIITQAKTPGLARYRIGVHRARMPSVASPKPAPVARAASFHRRMASLYERELVPAN
jgi:hypothetical protein